MLEPKHMMYWNISMLFLFLAVKTWTETYDVLKFKFIFCKIRYFNLEPKHMMYWNDYNPKIILNQDMAWTETYDVLKYKDAEDEPAINETWTETYDVLKYMTRGKVSNKVHLEPKHMMYWNI